MQLVSHTLAVPLQLQWLWLDSNALELLARCSLYRTHSWYACSCKGFRSTASELKLLDRSCVTCGVKTRTEKHRGRERDIGIEIACPNRPCLLLPQRWFWGPALPNSDRGKIGHLKTAMERDRNRGLIYTSGWHQGRMGWVDVRFACFLVQDSPSYITSRSV